MLREDSQVLITVFKSAEGSHVTAALAILRTIVWWRTGIICSTEAKKDKTIPKNSS